jgi:hypothetical protein
VAATNQVTLTFKLLTFNFFKMKNILKYISFAAILVIVLNSCIEDFGGTGKPFDRVEQLQGEWQLSSVIQVDEVAAERNFPYKELNLTSLFPYSDYKISFSANDSGVPTTFSVNRGNSPDIFGLTNGSWKLDDRDRPSEIQLTSEGKTVAVDFSSLNTLVSGELHLKKTRYRTNSKGVAKPVVSYVYIFNKK